MISAQHPARSVQLAIDVVCNGQVDVIYHGEVREFLLRPDAKALRLLDEARRAFAATVEPHLLGLFKISGERLDGSRSLSENDVRPGQELILRHPIVRET